jgi:hypothetical protein
LNGYDKYANNKDNVIVFFSEKPVNIELEQNKRRENGLKSAKWHSL